MQIIDLARAVGSKPDDIVGRGEVILIDGLKWKPQIWLDQDIRFVTLYCKSEFGLRLVAVPITC